MYPLRWLFAAFLFFLFAKAAYSEDLCVSESIEFAQCVDQCVSNKTCKTPKQIFESDCATQTKAYKECGQINKEAAADNFVKARLAALKTNETSDSPSHTIVE